MTFTDSEVRYIPDADFEWEDSFTYTISDWNGWIDIWTVEVKVNEEDEEDEEDEDNDNQYREKHTVQSIQKEFTAAFKLLKNQYKKSMNDRVLRNEYFALKAELFADYKQQLANVTWQAKKYSYEWESSKNVYKKNYDKKYWNKISQLSEPKLDTLIWKIDQLIIDVNEWDYSSDRKSEFNTMLLALRELVESSMDNYDDPLNIDSFFE